MSEKGFTLVETIVCLVVLALLAAVAYPEIGKWKAANTLRSETLTLVSNLKHARQIAIVRNEDVVLCYNEHGYKIFVDKGSGGGIKGDRIYQPSELLLKELIFDSRVKIVKAESTFQYDWALFSGKIGVKAGSVVLMNSNGEKRKIIMNIVGRLRVEKS